MIGARRNVLVSGGTSSGKTTLLQVRGTEALDLLQALNTEHGGSLSTIHAPGARARRGGWRPAPYRAATSCPGTRCALWWARRST